MKNNIEAMINYQGNYIVKLKEALQKKVNAGAIKPEMARRELDLAEDIYKTLELALYTPTAELVNKLAEVGDSKVDTTMQMMSHLTKVMSERDEAIKQHNRLLLEVQRFTKLFAKYSHNEEGENAQD